MEIKPSIYDHDKSELNEWLTTQKQPGFRTDQVWQGLYKNLYSTADQFTNIPKALKSKLSSHYSFSSLNPVKTTDSSDGNTTKVLFSLADASLIEVVLMRYPERRTLCISTQSGCAMGCTFCATGQMGFSRNLTSGEIIEQVIYFQRQLIAQEEKLTNIVTMGMGEPFHNYTHTMQAITQLNQQDGFNFGSRRFTVSTVGLVPMIRKFAEDHRQVNLAISLHAADDELRSSLLPINRKYPLEQLMSACKEYLAKTHRRITFEWALIKDVNDSSEQARKLTHLIGNLLCHVNLIPLNPIPGYSQERSAQNKALAFKALLENEGIPCTIRQRRGIEISAGCGQLAAAQKK